ncbi:MAG: 1-acyl-sn-glycerol-3-phosphate acyltransferase [Bacteroidales bacterium]
MNEKEKRHLFRDSWLWKALATYIFFLHRLFYKVIVVEGRENIPAEGPLIFAPNHQNALMDPLAVLFASSRQIVFLARADIFQNRILRPLYYWMKILPVYRIRDGKDNLQLNETSFETVVEVLEHGGSIGLFPEAAHSNKRHLLPMKKGVPRVAFLAEAKNEFSLGLRVVPVGIYYSHYESMGSVLHLKFGNPIPLSDFQAVFRESPQKAHLALRDELGRALRHLAIDIHHLEWYETYDTILILKVKKMARKMDKSKPFRIREFDSRKAIIASLDKQLEAHPERMQSLRKKVDQFLIMARRLNIKGNLLSEPKRSLAGLFANSILPVVCLPLFLYALLNHLPGYFIPQRLTRRFKDKQFHSSVKFLWGAFFLPVFYLMQSLLVLLVFNNNLIALYYAISLPFSGLLGHWLFRRYRVLLGRWKLFRLKKKAPGQLKIFHELRKSILNDVDFLLNL